MVWCKAMYCCYFCYRLDRTLSHFFFFQAEDGIRDYKVTGVQTCALPISRPDVLLHTGYNPDITLFLRQSKEQGFKVKAMIGHGAGHSQIDKLRQTFGDDVNYFHSIDPAAGQLLDPKTLKPGV